ncbi:MAG TPA: hypothetical protein VLI05_02595 [Candidatus Saccharimonadia bacterium]|nr:hypothetical protein [Candidatus Saccharimonadia bacterium]
MNPAREPGPIEPSDRLAGIRRCREAGDTCPLLAGPDRPRCDTPTQAVCVSFRDDQGRPVNALVGWSDSPTEAQHHAHQLTDPRSGCGRVITATVVDQTARAS